MGDVDAYLSPDPQGRLFDPVADVVVALLALPAITGDLIGERAFDWRLNAPQFHHIAQRIPRWCQSARNPDHLSASNSDQGLSP